MKKLIIAVILICLLSTSAFAAVPNEVVHEEHDGYHYIVKSFTLAPDEEPAELQEESFELLGYSYSMFSLTKEDNRFEDSAPHTETVTVETASNDMQEILAALPPSIEYDADGYTGTLTLNHTTIKTEASGYTSKYYTMTDTKTVPNLDRNDPSYIEKSTVKNGVTLSLSNVDWSVEAVDGDMNPISYTATAHYSGSYSSRIADGYITTASYSGQIDANVITSVTYKVTYIGQELEPVPEPEPEPTPEPEEKKGGILSSPFLLYPLIGIALLLLLYCIMKVTARMKPNMRICLPGKNGSATAIIARRKISDRTQVIDVSDLDLTDEEFVVEIDASAAARLYGKVVTIKYGNQTRSHRIEKANGQNYWFSVSPFSKQI